MDDVLDGVPGAGTILVNGGPRAGKGYFVSLMMPKTELYDELERRLQEAEEIISALRKEQVDAIVSENQVSLLEHRKLKRLNARLKSRTNQLQKLMLEVTEAEDRERRRVAEILHDDLQQILVSARFRLGTVGKSHGEPLQKELQPIDHLLEECLRKSRDLSHDLSPPVLEGGDFSSILLWLSEHMRSTYALEVSVQIRDNVRPHAHSLRVFLYRSVQELLFNVIKHAGVRRAEVKVHRRGNRLEVAVSDQGKGFEPRELQTRSLSEKAFGLFKIQQRIQMLGGKLNIESTPGLGSSFTLSIPSQALRQTPQPKSKAKRQQSVRQDRLKVLLVDDHRIVREGLMMLLADQSDIEVIGEAPHGKKGIELVEERNPDVVLMDIEMPVMDGIEATKVIKSRWPHIRVVALSVHVGDTEAEMKSAGADAYLTKNTPPERLLAAIRGIQPS